MTHDTGSDKKLQAPTGNVTLQQMLSGVEGTLLITAQHSFHAARCQPRKATLS